MKKVTDNTIRATQANLVEFGYTTLTFEDTKAAVELVMAGKNPAGNIIAMMAKNMLIENGYLADPHA